MYDLFIMIDVFTEEIEIQIKIGLTNIYWYLPDLKKAWLRSGVNPQLCNKLFAERRPEGGKYSKRELMDKLYEKLRCEDYNRRLEISRNFVRILVKHENFTPQNENHRVERAETAALRLKEIIRKQHEDKEYIRKIRQRAKESRKEDHYSQLMKLREKFHEAIKQPAQKRGYELEKIFYDLMVISGIPVDKPFKIEGEQIDGAIKYDGHYYLIELKWTEKKIGQGEVSNFYLKVEGKLDQRGIFISMGFYSKELIKSLPKGKPIKVILLDGLHIVNVINGLYTFQELLEHALNQASLRGEIYCSHDLKSK